MEKGRENAVLFPFMAEGHIIPFLALAQQLKQKGYAVTFVNTPLNIKKIRNSLSPEFSMKLVEIPFKSSDHDLPPDSENADSLPHNLAVRLLEASLSLKLGFKNLLSNLIGEQGGEKPVCVISDIFFGWSADVAHECGVFHVIFSPAGGFGLACYYSMWLNLPHKSAGPQDYEFLLPDFPEAGDFNGSQLIPLILEAGEDDPFTNFQWKNLPTWGNSDGILFNTIEEIEGIGLTYFHRKLGIPVWAVGPLLLSEDDRARIGREATISPEQCNEWLDRKEANSVIYISFGSQNTISASQMKKLAKALYASGRNFIWVVRPPLGFDKNSKFVPEEWLPEEFLQQIQDQDRGLIVNKWAPQVEILAHKSVSAFISSCGWNSVLESLKNGVPLISWPMAAEEYYNAKFLVEQVGVCVEVARGNDLAVVEEYIMEKIERVMGENEEGNKIRRKSCEIKEIIRNAMREEENYKGSSVQAMEKFLVAALLAKEKTITKAK